MSRRTLFFKILLITIVSFFNALHAQFYRIMPLGDSITEGQGDPDKTSDGLFNGYRDDLWVLLTNNGWTPDFVGSQTDGDIQLFDVNHEGHGGWRADEINAIVSSRLAMYSPDVVLLHIGTNDISQGLILQSIANEIENIVENIYSYNPQKAILLCTLIPRAADAYNNHLRTEQLNNLILQLYADKKAIGYNIYLVNQYEAFTDNANWQADYMYDDVHPKNAGYSVMAQQFFTVLQTVSLVGEKYILSVAVNPSGAGSVSINPAKNEYDPGDQVSLTAYPSGDYLFNYWSGDIQQQSTNPVYIVMIKSRSIVANFRSPNDEEIVTIPNTPTGSATGSTGASLIFSTGGSTSNKGNEVEYQFSWGDGNNSSWGDETQTYSYDTEGIYQVKARARSVPNPTIVSAWSGGLTINIETSTVTYALTIGTNPDGAGSVSKVPDKSVYAEGESVQLTAVGNNDGIQVTDKVYLEGESGSLSGTMQIGDDTDASGANYIYCTSAVQESGRADYTFDILEAGTYVIWGRCYALSGNQDSFFMTVDGGAKLIWHLNAPLNTWLWQKVSDSYVEQQFYLTAGTHKISIISREELARLDKIILSKDLEFQPSGKEFSPNLPYGFSYWSGDLNGSDNPAILSMNRNKSVIANFEILNETISTPTKPNGLISGRVGETLTYSSGGAASDLQHNIEYQFDWGDGSQSSWGALSASHQFSSAGTFSIKARARCKQHINIVSSWSPSLTVTITLFTGYTLSVNIDPAGAGRVSKVLSKAAYEENEWVEMKAIPYRVDSNIRLEAESGEFSGQMSTGTSLEASGGRYIYSTTSAPQDGSVEYTFTILEAGTYVIWGRCYALSDAEDSFFIGVDNSGSMLTWHLDASYNNWFWQLISNDRIEQDFYFAAGQHTLKVIKRDKNVRLDKLLITSDPSYQPEGKEEITEIRLEAEKGVIVAPMAIGNNVDASGGQYIYGTTSVPQDGNAEYTFQIMEAGYYEIWGRCYALSEIKDSFFIQADGTGNLITWHLNSIYNSWEWQKVTDNKNPTEFFFAIGQHSLKVIKRDADARLDKIIITKDPFFQPQGKEDGAAPNVNYRFDHWSGDVLGNSNPIEILMNSNKIVTAHFIEADHLVTPPTSVTGPTTAFVGEQAIFTTSGAISSKGHNIVYQFDWGDGNLSNWTNGSNNHTYYAAGIKTIKTRARSVIDTSAISNWSESVILAVSGLTLSITADPVNSGQVTKDPSKAEYAFNEVVTLTPSPALGYAFAFWSGDLSGNSNPASITMNTNKTVSAVFVQAAETVTKPNILNGPNNGIMGEVLTFSTGGSVSSLGNAVEYQFNWGDGMESQWGNGTEAHIYYATGVMPVKSRARSKQNSSIVSAWTDPHNVTLDGYTINMVVSPPNSGSITNTPQKPKYASGELVSLSAFANQGYVFDHWSGHATGKTNPVSVVINENKQILAYFIASQEMVSEPTFISGPDTGNVNQSLSFTTGGAVDNLYHPLEYQFNWGDSTLSYWGDSTNSHTYTTAGIMSVKARARSMLNISIVSNWSNTHQVIVLSSNYKIKITVDPPNKGSVNLTPPKTEYEPGTVVILSPNAVYGYIFDKWSGDLTGTNYPAYLIVNANKYITAHFKLISSVAEEKDIIPDQFALHQNFPNPFNPETVIGYQLAKQSNVRISIYDLQGHLIDTPVSEYQPAGYYQLKWKAVDVFGNKVPSGVFLYRLETENYTSVKKMILMK